MGDVIGPIGNTSVSIKRLGHAGVPTGFSPQAAVVKADLRVRAPEVTGFSAPAPIEVHTSLQTRHLLLRPLEEADQTSFVETVDANGSWLEASASGLLDDAIRDENGFADWLLEASFLRVLDQLYTFGLFEDDILVGMTALQGIVRGEFQSGFVSLWITQDAAGRRLAEEAFVAMCRFAFEDLILHRVEAAVLPDNDAVVRAIGRLGLRDEGVAARYLQMNGVWRDHRRFAVTSEDWESHGDHLLDTWVR